MDDLARVCVREAGEDLIDDRGGLAVLALALGAMLRRRRR
jgi:MYXO-CTERM domain-containing protein